MGSGYSAEPTLAKQQRESEALEQKLDTLLDKVAKIEGRVPALPKQAEPLPTASGTLPVMQMSRFRKCMEEVRNHPYY